MPYVLSCFCTFASASLFLEGFLQHLHYLVNEWTHHILYSLAFLLSQVSTFLIEPHCYSSPSFPTAAENQNQNILIGFLEPWCRHYIWCIERLNKHFLNECTHNLDSQILFILATKVLYIVRGQWLPEFNHRAASRFWTVPLLFNALTKMAECKHISHISRTSVGKNLGKTQNT